MVHGKLKTKEGRWEAGTPLSSDCKQQDLVLPSLIFVQHSSVSPVETVSLIRWLILLCLSLSNGLCEVVSLWVYLLEYNILLLKVSAVLFISTKLVQISFLFIVRYVR